MQHTRLLLVNGLNLCDKDSFGCCLQFQHSVYRNHSMAGMHCNTEASPNTSS